jgi:hypothetical protein
MVSSCSGRENEVERAEIALLLFTVTEGFPDVGPYMTVKGDWALNREKHGDSAAKVSDWPPVSRRGD